LIERTRTQYTELIEKIDTNNKNIEDATAEFSTIRATFDEERKRLQATNQQQETNRVTLQKKYDANQTRIAELEKAINEHPTTRATVIANAKDKRIPQKQIDDYIAGLDKMDAANKQELAQLKQQQQTLKNAMESNDFL
jgi:chromosome segregation ATPase